ncbi:MAG TPA: hypothetical protein VG323_02720 [Thermoanaerobaculia bacterium]|nr:hypothetical protein [Thermoanaerobaculia bacterium]
MANVNITAENGVDGSLTIRPWKVKVGGAGGDLKIIWNVASGAGGWKFSTTKSGIVCEKTPPPGYDAWDGTVATAGPGPNQFNATAPKVSAGKKYKYSIHLVNDVGQVIDIDPEIMNDP